MGTNPPECPPEEPDCADEVQASETDQRLEALEIRAHHLTQEATEATTAAASALRDLHQALKSARANMRERGFPLANEMEPR